MKGMMNMDEKLKGVLAYIFSWVGGLIVLLAFKDNNRKTAFHACQAIVIGLCVVVASLVLSAFNIVSLFTVVFPFKFIFGMLSAIASSAVGILYIILMILGIVKVANDEDDPKLPVVGDLTLKIFEQKINSFPEEYVSPDKPKFDPETGKPVKEKSEKKKTTKKVEKKENKTEEKK